MTKVMSPWEFKFMYSAMIAPLFQPRCCVGHWGRAVSKVGMAPDFVVFAVQGGKTDIE